MQVFSRLERIVLAAFVFTLTFSIQAGAKETDRCPRLVAERTPTIVLASLRFAQIGTREVKLTFIGHSTFLIESPKGVRIATDYNDYVRPNILPDIVTMNRAHSTHFTNFRTRISNMCSVDGEKAEVRRSMNLSSKMSGSGMS